MYDMVCPYCDEGFDYSDDEPRGEDVQDFTECPVCSKTFVFTRCYSVSYNTDRADCLNGSPHSFKESNRYPMIMFDKVKWECSQCGKEENRMVESGENTND